MVIRGATKVQGIKGRTIKKNVDVGGGERQTRRGQLAGGWRLDVELQLQRRLGHILWVWVIEMKVRRICKGQKKHKKKYIGPAWSFMFRPTHWQVASAEHIVDPPIMPAELPHCI